MLTSGALAPSAWARYAHFSKVWNDHFFGEPDPIADRFQKYEPDPIVDRFLRIWARSDRRSFPIVSPIVFQSFFPIISDSFSDFFYHFSDCFQFIKQKLEKIMQSDKKRSENDLKKDRTDHLKNEPDPIADRFQKNELDQIAIV